MSQIKSKVNNWNELRKEIRKVPINEAIREREGKLEIQQKGYQKFGICPFHNDEEIGSFALGGPHNGYKCFSCGASGDIISLVMKMDNVSFKEALLILALELDIMSEEDIEDFQKKGDASVIKKKDWGGYMSTDPYVELDDEQIKKRHAVYSLLSEGDAIINPLADALGQEKQHRLSDKHYYQLRNERGLTDKQIDEAGFFTMSEDYQYLTVLYYRLTVDMGLAPNTLNVPGFWRKKDGPTLTQIDDIDGNLIDFTNMDEDQYYWYFNPTDALGIPIRNLDGKIIAIQLRPDNSDNSGKYVWFSSAYATGKKGKIDGLSPGAQHDISYPESWNTPHLFITEGKFKSLAITKSLRSTSISLQGVNTFSGIKDEIEEISENHVKDVENVFIAFDADLSFNDAVMKATVNMIEKELDEYNVYIAVWDYLFGKGIDDLIQNGHGKKISKITPEQLIEIRDILKEQCPMNNKDNVEEIKNKREDVFYKWLKTINPEIELHQNRK